MKVKEIAKKMKNKGYYLIGITAIDIGDYFEIIYHFCKGKDRKDFRFLARKGEIIQTISDIFPNAYIYEWEEYESMGVNFENARKIFGGEND